MKIGRAILDRILTNLTRCSDCEVRARTCGRTKLQMSTSSGCGKGGNEPHLLGYKSLHLPDRGQELNCRTGRGSAEENASAGGPAADTEAHLGRNSSEAAPDG